MRFFNTLSYISMVTDLRLWWITWRLHQIVTRKMICHLRIKKIWKWWQLQTKHSKTHQYYGSPGPVYPLQIQLLKLFELLPVSTKIPWSTQWWIQDFLGEGAPTAKVGVPTYPFGQCVLKTAWKWKKWIHGRHESLAPPWTRHATTRQFVVG